jgi:hypothetical protein
VNFCAKDIMKTPCAPRIRSKACSAPSAWRNCTCLAAELEAALRNQSDLGEPLLARLEEELAALMAALKRLPPTASAPPSTVARPIEWPDLRQKLQELRRHLESADMASARLYACLRPILESAVGGTAIALDQRIEDMEFDEALEILNGIAARLGMSPLDERALP